MGEETVTIKGRDPPVGEAATEPGPISLILGNTETVHCHGNM